MPYKIHSVQLNRDAEAGSAVNIPDCTNQSLDNNPTLERVITAGRIQPKHVSLVAQSVVGSFDTFSLPTAIDALGIKPSSIATVTYPGVYFYLQKFDDNGLASAGSVHRSLLVSGGVVVPRRLTCAHQGNAVLTCDVVVVKESANNAIVIADTASLPSLSNEGLRWTLGDIDVAGVTLSDYTSVEVDFGNTVNTRGTQSDIWDEHVETRTHAPMITITGIDPAWFKESGGIGIDGDACTQANTIIYLRKRATDGSGFVANGTAEHIELTSAGVAVVQSPVRGAAQTYTDTSIVIHCIEDGSANDPIVVDTSSAIT